MATCSNIGSYLVVDSNEQVCKKAALHDLAAKKFTALRQEDVCYWPQHDQGKVFAYQTSPAAGIMTYASPGPLLSAASFHRRDSEFGGA